MPPDRLRRLFVFGLFAAAVPPPGAFAAPTCQNRDGETVKCGTSDAMPVGWTLSANSGHEGERRSPAPATLVQLFELLSALGIFFALLALMPEFDGSHPGEWDREEGDHSQRK